MQRFFTLYIYLFLTFLPLTSLSQSWNKVSTIPLPYGSNYWLDVYFLPSNPNYGWICGFRGQVIRTTDRGKTWSGSVVQNADQLESIHFSSLTVGYTSGMDGIFKTVNSGASWFEITPPGALQVWGNFFLDDNNGVTVGEGCNGMQKFWRTTNGGANWTLYTDSVPNTGMSDVMLYPGGLGFATSSGKIWITTDGGSTWQVHATSGPNIWQEEITNIGASFLVPFGGTSCSGNGNGGGMIFSTNDGTNWKSYTTGIPMFGAFLIDPNTGWVCGYNREVYFTSDAGQTWIKRNCGIDRGNLDDIWFITPAEGWVVGEGVYYLGPDRQDITKLNMVYGDVCIPGAKYDTLWVKNHSFNNAVMVSTSLFGTNYEDFSVIFPPGSIALPACDSQMIIVRFNPKLAGDGKNAKLGVNVLSGSNFTVDLLGNAKEMTGVPEDTLVEMNPAFCGMKTVDSLKWVSASPDNNIISIQKTDGNYEIVSESPPPINIYTSGIYTNFSAMPSDTGWFTSRFKFTLSPCSKDTFITVRAYGISPIITADDRLNFNLNCKLTGLDTIPIFNTGNSELIISEYKFNGANSAFSYIGWTSGRIFPLTIKPLEGDSLIIKFTPPISGNHSAVMSLTNNDSTTARGRKNPYYLSFSGIVTSTDIIPKDTVFELGDICLGDSIVFNMPLKNRGDLTATLQNPVINNKNYKISIQGKTFPLQMKSNDSVMSKITFTPDSARQYHDTILITSLPCNEVLRIVVNANCIDSYITINPDSISGVIQTGLPLRKTVTVHAFGNIPMSISEIRLVPSQTDWSITVSPSLPYNINGGDSIEFKIDFTSTKDTLLVTNLVCTLESQCPMQEGIPVELLSHSIWLLTSADFVGFGYKRCIEEIVYDTLTITNGGSIDDTLTRLEIQPSNSPFSILNIPSIPHIISAGTSEDYIVAYNASGEGIFLGNLVVDSKNLKGLTINLPVSGEFRKVNSSPSVTSFDFDDVEPCQDTIVKTFYFKNTGTLSDSLIIGRKNNINGFDIFPQNSFVVTPGDSVLISVFLYPPAFNNTGNYIEQFKLTSSVCGNIYTVDVRVNIISPKLTIEPRSLEFDNIWIGDSMTKTINIKNETSYNRTIDSIAIVPASTQFTFKAQFPVTFVPDAELNIPVTFNSRQEGIEQKRFRVIEESYCIDTSYVDLSASVPKEIYYTTVKIGNYRVYQMDSLMIETELLDAVPRVKPDGLNFSIAFDKRLFYPLNVFVKSGNSKQQVNFTYLGDTIVVSLNKQYSEMLLQDTGKIFFIQGLILTSYPDSTGLVISKFNPVTSKIVNVTTIDGSIKVLGVCPAIGKLVLEFANNLNMALGEIVINSDRLKIEVLIPDEQNLNSEIWDLMGNRVRSEQIKISNTTRDFSLDLSGLSDGAYILTFNSDKFYSARYKFIIYR
ncbi:MAG: choice-of-anchor D domain-containing protein [Ignavibacteriae bacterium]|nr:choice-of-anchor D domain-containing protein [Ignavibacteriota bacterium]